MVFISATVQSKLLDAGRRHLGAGGDAVIRDTTLELFNIPLEQLTYPQLPKLITALEREAPARAGREPALQLAAGLDRLHEEIDSGFSTHLVAAVSRRMGPAAEPFLTAVCARNGLSLATIDRSHLGVIADAARQDAAALLGEDTAAALATAIREAASGTSAGLAGRIVDVATQNVGTEGEAIIRSICRSRLEIDIEELDLHGITLLARAVERDGPAKIGPLLSTAFVAAARLAMTSNAEPLRAKILALATRYVGPAGPDFVKEACAKAGMPFQAVDYEHLMWLAEALRAEAQPLIGKKAADEIARSVRSILTGQ